MDKKKKTFLTILIISVVAVTVAVVIFKVAKPLPEINEMPTVAQTTVKAPDDEPTPYISPVDFKLLNKRNADIYAWLEIPSLRLSLPVVQNKDDTKYLRRDIDGKKDINGTLFTESAYNKKDFTDPVTIIYGHSMKDGSMFGGLQKAYSSAENINKNSEIIVYLPEGELHYKVFAAVPYDNRHILYNYDFTDARIFRLFFRDIFSIRALESAFSDDAYVAKDDSILILSTCLLGNKYKRFLVCAKLEQIEGSQQTQ